MNRQMNSHSTLLLNSKQTTGNNEGGSMMSLDNNTFRSMVTNMRRSEVENMLQLGSNRPEWGLYGMTMGKDQAMMIILLKNGVEPMDEDVDNCIREHDLDTAKDFVEQYGCSPTERVFEALFENKNNSTPVDVYEQILEWLYYDQECGIDEEVVANVARMGVSHVVVDWFMERME